MDENRILTDDELRTKLEELRKKKLKGYIFFGVGAVLAVVGVISEMPFLFALAGVCFIAGASVAGKIGKEEKKLVGDNITTGILKEIFDIKVYKPEEHISEGVVKKTNLITGSWNTINGSDYFEGSYRGVPITVSDLHLENVYTTTHVDSKGHVHTEEHRITVFQGQWIILKLAKPSPSMLVVREKDEKLFGGYCKQKGDVEVEDVEFNTKYQIKTNDPHNAFYILTPHFMEYIKKTDNFANAKTGLCFMGNELHFICHNNSNLFEVHSSVRDIDSIRAGMRREAAYITGMVDELLKNNNLFDAEKQGGK